MRRLILVVLGLALACTAAPDAAPPAGSAATAAPRVETPNIPAFVLSIVDIVRRTSAPPPGYRGGTRFYNDGRDGEPTLPATTPAGRSITYREWDVHPWVRGVNRGAERLVTGSDGSAYYTADHYRTFTRIDAAPGLR